MSDRIVGFRKGGELYCLFCEDGELIYEEEEVEKLPFCSKCGDLIEGLAFRGKAFEEAKDYILRFVRKGEGDKWTAKYLWQWEREWIPFTNDERKEVKESLGF